MIDLIDRKALMRNFCGYDLSECTKYGNKTAEQQSNSYSTMMMYEIADEIEDAPAVDAVPRGVLEQIRWERDIAIEQLNSYGVSLGEKADCAKVVRCKDCEKRDKSADLTFDVFCRWFEAVMDKNDFCSEGERREDDG